MKREIKAPSVGESITEVRILRWVKPDGAAVKVGDQILEIESDKATVEVVAEFAGAVRVSQPEGATVAVGSVIGFIEEGAAGVAATSAPAASASVQAPVATAAASSPAPTSAPSGASREELAPSVRRLVSENQVDPSAVKGTGLGGRLTKADVLGFMETSPASGSTGAVVPSSTGVPAAPQASAPAPRVSLSSAAQRALDPRGEKRSPMSLLRTKIAQRLVEAQHTAAILTTFNEIDMSPVNQVRSQYKEAFKAKYGVNLGYMSFFSRAVVEAMAAVPMVNASIDGADIISRDFIDLGIAIGTPRGLVVPVLRDAQKLDFSQIELGIAQFAAKGKEGKLSIKDLSGGTFTISNGGTYGSLLSTPILTPPQTGILGMHKIEDRAVVVGGQIVVRPMMYVALSYDHRLIDGKEAVTFLVKMKEFLENPTTLFANGKGLGL